MKHTGTKVAIETHAIVLNSSRTLVRCSMSNTQGSHLSGQQLSGAIEKPPHVFRTISEYRASSYPAFSLEFFSLVLAKSAPDSSQVGELERIREAVIHHRATGAGFCHHFSGVGFSPACTQESSLGVFRIRKPHLGVWRIYTRALFLPHKFISHASIPLLIENTR